MAHPAEDAPDQLVLERFLPFKLAILSNRIAGRFEARYARKHDLSIPEWRVFGAIGSHQGITASGVIDLTDLEKSQVSRVVARLLERGLIMRHANDEDRRWQHLYLTPAGLKVYRALAPGALEMERNLVSHLTADELVRFEEIVDRLYRAAKDL